MVHLFSLEHRRRPCAAPAAWLVALSAAALTAHAQPAARAARPDPLDPNASIPALNYQSSFKPDLRVDNGKPISWREANDTVARIGGWRVYAREAQQAEPAPEAKPAGHTGNPRP